jgi:hypothetical protein
LKSSISFIVSAVIVTTSSGCWIRSGKAFDLAPRKSPIIVSRLRKAQGISSWQK